MPGFIEFIPFEFRFLGRGQDGGSSEEYWKAKDSTKLIDDDDVQRGFERFTKKTYDLSQTILQYIQGYENGLINYMTKNGIIKNYYSFLVSMQKDLTAIEMLLRDLSRPEKNIVDANVLVVLTKSLYCVLPSNEERLVLETIGLNKIDVISMHQRVYGGVINFERRYESNLSNFKLSFLEEILENKLLFNHINQTSDKKLLEEVKKSLQCDFFMFDELINSHPDKLIDEYANILSGLFGLLKDVRIETTLNNVYTRNKRIIHKIENVETEKKETKDECERRKLDCKADIVKKVEQAGLVGATDAIMEYMKIKSRHFLDLFDMFQISETRSEEVIDTYVKISVGFELKPIDNRKENLEYLVGCDDQIKIMERIFDNFLKYGNEKGPKIIALKGKPGIGKTATVLALASGRDNLKTIELCPEDLNCLPNMCKELGALDYKFILYCDDLKYKNGYNAWESLSKVVDRVEKFPNNSIIILSTNAQLDEEEDSLNSIFSRMRIIPYMFDYKSTRNELIKKLCEKHSMQFEEKYISHVHKKTGLHYYGGAWKPWKWFRREFERNPRGIEQCLCELARE